MHSNLFPKVFYYFCSVQHSSCEAVTTDGIYQLKVKSLQFEVSFIRGYWLFHDYLSVWFSVLNLWFWVRKQTLSSVHKRRWCILTTWHRQPWYFSTQFRSAFTSKDYFLGKKTGGYSIKLYTWRLHPEVQPLSLYTRTIFDRKGPPFIYLIMTNGTSFHRPVFATLHPF